MQQKMKLLKQSASTNSVFTTDDYYINNLQLTQMDIIESLFQDYKHPLMVIGGDDRAVYYINEVAKSALNNTDIIGHSFEELVNVCSYTPSPLTTAFFGDKWYQLVEKPFQFQEESYLLVQFEEISHIPNADTLNSWKQMIAVMLHRFRSPLTGMAGYLEMLQDDNESSESEPYILAINKGLNRLFDMMDELEILYNVSENFSSEVSQTVNAREVAEQVRLTFSPEIQQRISIHTSTATSNFSCSRLNLKRILEILIQNGIDHTAAHTPITISITSPQRIDVTTTGASIPQDIKNTMFQPFITNTANNLGIGLPLALLYAQQFGGALFYSEKAEDQEVTFSLCFP